MIKECPVIFSNEYVTVVRFDNINVQLPSIQNNTKTVIVKKHDGKYTIVDTSELSTHHNNLCDVCNELIKERNSPPRKPKSKRVSKESLYDSETLIDKSTEDKKHAD